MAPPDPPGQDQTKPLALASPIAEILYDLLVDAIRNASHDPNRLQDLVHAMAHRGIEISTLLSSAQFRARADSDLMRELQRVIARLEGDATERVGDAPDASQSATQATTENPAQPHGSDNPFSDGWPPAGEEEPVSNGSEVPPSLSGNPFRDRWPYGDPFTEPWPSPRPIEPSSEAFLSETGATRPSSSSNALVVVPERMTQLQVIDERFQPWLEHQIRNSLQRMDLVPRPHPVWTSFSSFLQLVSGAAIAIVLLIAFTGWPDFGRKPVVGGMQQAEQPPAPPPSRPAEPVSPAIPPEPKLPFPLPRTFGVYAVNSDELVELDPLPIKVPVARVPLSAEISTPSKVTIAGEKLTFVIYRRDLVSSAPQAAPVRVVARVTRTMKFVNGKPVTTPVEASWRIRDKAYALKVSPLESNREMIIIQPDPGFVLPPGRYALVLSGYGYDFTVAGSVTGTEQCLEQAEVTNSVVLSECAKP